VSSTNGFRCWNTVVIRNPRNVWKTLGSLLPEPLFIPNKFLPAGWGVAQMRPLLIPALVDERGQNGPVPQADLSTEDDVDVEVVFTLVTGITKDLLPVW
jgi:hypothetical protein